MLFCDWFPLLLAQLRLYKKKEDKKGKENRRQQERKA